LLINALRNDVLEDANLLDNNTDRLKTWQKTLFVVK
jgi:hypothetical protein